jgi:hypothetical protein
LFGAGLVVVIFCDLSDGLIVAAASIDGRWVQVCSSFNSY